MILFLALACTPGVVLVKFKVDGQTRSYFEHVPDGLEKGAATVLVLHGGGKKSANAGRGMNRYTGFGDLADAGNYLAIYPNSAKGNWNDGRGMAEADDVLYFDALLDHLADRHGLDPGRVGLVGISNGGFMTQRLLCERSDRFVGGVSIVATMAENLVCEPSQPVSVAILAGTADPLVPYDGGVVSGDRGRILPAEQVRDEWVVRNGCVGEPTTSELPDVDPKDGSTIEEQRWDECEDGTVVDFLRFDGGGHGWPGASQYLPELVIGAVNYDVDAAVWSEAFLGLR